MRSYYYRGGRRVPVVYSSSAFVVPRPVEALSGLDPGWRATPIARHHAVVARDAVVGSAPGWPAIGALIALDAGRPPPPGAHDVPVEAPTPDALPIVVAGEGRMLLMATGAVVAHFARTPVEAGLAARGWRVERAVQFLDGAFVLRRSSPGAVCPLVLANALVEHEGCRFAHPVFLEELVRARAAGR